MNPTQNYFIYSTLKGAGYVFFVASLGLAVATRFTNPPDYAMLSAVSAAIISQSSSHTAAMLEPISALEKKLEPDSK